jgi:biofilm protein TabA
MIFDLLTNQALYRSLHPGFAAGFDWLLRFDPSTADGRYAIDGDAVFALVQTFTTAPVAEKRFESHLKYIDIQCVIRGTEMMQVAPRGELTVTEPYQEARDIAFYSSSKSCTDLVCPPGSFALFYPHDGHKPCCLVGAAQTVQKVVIKVKL